MGKMLLLSALAAVLLIGGCARKAPDSPKPSAAASQHSVVIDSLDGPDPGVTLDDALAKVGVPVSLPDTATAGPIKKIALDETTTDQRGRPGLLILYISGVKLFVSRAPHSIPALDATAVFARTAVGGVPVLVRQASAQVDSHGGTVELPARMMWNDHGLGYALNGTGTTDTAQLLAIMRSMF